MLTEAKNLFERFCNEHALQLRRLSEGDNRIPDYELQLNDVTVAIEVKQLEPNKNDDELVANPKDRGARARFINMGRVRQKLRVGTKQLRSYTKKHFPGMVVLFDARGPTGYLDPISIARSMYGKNNSRTAVSNDRHEDPWTARLHSAGNRVASDVHNTSLSAVGVLRRSGEDGSLSIDVFHNRFAANPLPAELLRCDGVKHFAFTSWDRQTLPSWVEV